MKFVFQSVSIEQVKKPGQKAPYGKATVFYTYNGEPRKQTIVSIFNPTVFKQVQELEQGAEIDVEITKNEAGYNEWKSITTGGIQQATGIPSASAPSATRVTGSNYETRDERAARQVLIVKQSSLSAAVASLTPGAKAVLTTDDVLKRAQEYADWVFDSEAEVSEGD